MIFHFLFFILHLIYLLNSHSWRLIYSIQSELYQGFPLWLGLHFYYYFHLLAIHHNLDHHIFYFFIQLLFYWSKLLVPFALDLLVVINVNQLLLYLDLQEHIKEWYNIFLLFFYSKQKQERCFEAKNNKKDC